jgi:hypothetical protein
VLPDSFKPKIPIWIHLEGLAKEDAGIFMTSWSILLSNGIFYGHLVRLVVWVW